MNPDVNRRSFLGTGAVGLGYFFTAPAYSAARTARKPNETLQFAGSHLLTSLLAFNIGVELGQVLILVLFIAALDLFFRFAVRERIGAILLSALAAHTAWHWMIDRAERLSQYRIGIPDLGFPAVVAIAAAAVLLITWSGVKRFANPE